MNMTAIGVSANTRSLAGLMAKFASLEEGRDVDRVQEISKGLLLFKALACLTPKLDGLRLARCRY